MITKKSSYFNYNQFKVEISKSSQLIHPERKKSYLKAYRNLLYYQKLDKAQQKVFLRRELTINMPIEVMKNNSLAFSIIDHKGRNHTAISLPFNHLYPLICQKIQLPSELETKILTLSMIIFGPERKIEKINSKTGKQFECYKPLRHGGVELKISKKQHYIAIIKEGSKNKIKIVGCALITDHGKKNTIDEGVQLSRVASFEPKNGIASALQVATILLNQDRMIFLHSRYAHNDHLHAPMDRRYIYSNFFRQKDAPFIYQGLENIRMESMIEDKLRQEVINHNLVDNGLVPK